LIAAEALGRQVGVSSACDVLIVSRATLYRRRQPVQKTSGRNPPPRALSAQERDNVRQELYSKRFIDQSPYQVYAALLDEGSYLCSVRTMYRILAQHNANRERRNQLTRPNYRKPELLATGPNQVWSWDITKLKGPETWTYYYLYVILDIFSRYTVGWMLAHREQADLAKKLIEETIEKQKVQRDQLIIHSDRGPSMTSHSVANLLGSLGVTKSLSRPHVSNDNPYSESHFKTMKYQPEFPDRFGSYQDALSHSRQFFGWYNDEHYHSGIGLVTPASLHYGLAQRIIASRTSTLSLAYAANPERFVCGVPRPAKLPTAAWINPPTSSPINEKRPPEIHCPEGPQEASLTHPRFGYPWAGCVPAAPASVSPNATNLTANKTLNTRAMPEKIPGVRGSTPDYTGLRL
jgi:putative transposase